MIFWFLGKMEFCQVKILGGKIGFGICKCKRDYIKKIASSIDMEGNCDRVCVFVGISK